MEDVLNSTHGLVQSTRITDIADDVAELRPTALHFPLLLLVATEDADLRWVQFEKMARDAVTKGAGAPGDQDGRAGKRSHGRFLSKCCFQGQRFVVVLQWFDASPTTISTLCRFSSIISANDDSVDC